MKRIAICDNCQKEKELIYGIDWEDSYSEYCSKECAKEDLEKHKEDLIYELSY